MHRGQLVWDGSSQGGQISMLMGRDVLTGSKTPFCVLNWSSRRLRRVARSATSAEAQMSANALDNHGFAKLAFLDMTLPEGLICEGLMNTCPVLNHAWSVMRAIFLMVWSKLKLLVCKWRRNVRRLNSLPLRKGCHRPGPP